MHASLPKALEYFTQMYKTQQNENKWEHYKNKIYPVIRLRYEMIVIMN